jgi:LacI family transcriptional regulator
LKNLLTMTTDMVFYVEALPNYSVTPNPVPAPLMGVTIYDLAREAGVGIGTVSRCLNSHPSVSPHTRAKVLSAVKQLGYQPHANAQRLASKRTNTISTIIPFFTNYFFVEVLQGIQDKAAELGFDLMLCGVNHPSQVEYYLGRSLRRGHVDGVMFFSMKFSEAYAAKFRQINLPVVLVDTYHEHFDSIRIRNCDGAAEATRHLLHLGHRNIAMINAIPDAQPSRDRLEGYRKALEEFGVRFRTDRVLYPRVTKHDGFNREAGRASMKELIRMNGRPDGVTAVFVASDVQAIGALEAARELGVRVPEDIAVVSFDDIELAKYAYLTTMRQPMYEMGALAMERLHSRLKNPPAPPTLTTFLPELVVRRSCGASLLFNRSVEIGSRIELEESKIGAL